MTPATTLLALAVGCTGDVTEDRPRADDSATQETAGPTADTGQTTPTVPDAPEFAFLAAQQLEGLGLLESFVDHDELPADFRSYLQSARPAFVYDSALAAIAWLGRDAPGDRERAAAVLDGILAVQQADGSLRSPVNVATGDGPIDQSTGNLTWSMLAWLAGFERTGNPAWRDAAERTARFLLRPDQQSTVDFGGFRLAPGQTAMATEHNLDAWPAFARLGELLDDDAMRDAATRARLFAEARFDPVTGAVFAGTQAGGRLTARSPVPLDTQSWSVLSLGREKWRESFAFARTTAPGGLWTDSVGCPGARGPGFSSADTSDVWTEGLAQMLAAARLLGEDGAATEMEAALDVVRTSPRPAGPGFVAACRPIDTGFGSSYFDSLAVGAAAWVAMAHVGIDPFWFRPLDEGLATHPAAGLPSIRLDVPTGAVFSCTGTAPCRFAVTGAVTPSDAALHLLVEPLIPDPLGTWFTQATPATVQPDGRFVVDGQLGSPEFPVSPGDGLRLVVVAVDGAAPPAQLERITPATVPGILATSGLLSASVK